MSTSILYHAFGLKGIRHTSTHFRSDAVIFRAEMTSDLIRCPRCGCRHASFKGRKSRWFFMSPIGRKKCYLVFDFHRLKCEDCAHLWWPSLPFMTGKHRYVRSFALTVLDLLRFGTIRSVAHYLGVGWDMVKEIHKAKLRLLYRRISLHKVRYIGIDEFSIKKGHKYMTVVTDLRTGRILHAVEGKSKEDILPFLQKLARKARKLEGIAMDMSSAYFYAVLEALPKLDIVFDRYHIMALVNQAIEELRREQQRELDDLGKKTDHPANEYPVSVMCWNDKAKELAADYHYSNFPFDRIALAPQELEGCSGEGEICPRRRMNLSHSISIT